ERKDISSIKKKNNSPNSKLISTNHINPFYSISPKSNILQQSLKQNHKTIHIFLNQNKKSQSLLILSSSNYFKINPFNHIKHHNIINQSIKKKYSNYN
ncbi:hypothetical protein, partial [Escherichia coli]